MTKDEMKNRISLALKDPMLQQGFEIICKEIAELKEVNSDLKQSLDWANERESEDVNRIAELEAENANLKARLNAINLLTPELEKQSKAIKQQLTKAKRYIKELLRAVESSYSALSWQRPPIETEAEKFLRENEE